MTSSLLLVVSGLVATHLFLRCLLTLTHDAKEPPALATEMPFLGPIIGIRKKAKFYMDLRQRHYRILDFAPIKAKIAINVMGANGVEDFSYVILFDKAIHSAVAPGPKLDAMNRLSVQKVAEVLDILASKFEPGIITLLLNLNPNILAKESTQARKDIVGAFNEYFVSRSHEQGSAFVQAHYQHKVGQGATGKDIARFESGAIFAILSNTIPATFWVLYHAISDVAVLEECRQEIIACCKVDGDTCTIDITELKASFVTQDHILDGKYVLKKGNIVMIPGPVQHTSIPAYGDNVGEFQHKRFVRSPGRSTLCPGRNFASTEVLTFVALMIVRFDFGPTRGEWICPKTDKARMHGALAPPNDDVEVRITPRAGELAGKKWIVELSGSDKEVELSVEGIHETPK
ncbi:cytochrome P450 [Melanomma pulvis-pyrius CBS 109.77]|uniref:Cytochrome P450 n=1 Tax=Melanomma pulvis-pyrius CBS 109.77 TaxID=1314802 RepID=A0A6A6WZW2_9PLEO|nr:cytochrome P450 [Melanomma pulvis-pyrius CBS 109.77]